MICTNNNSGEKKMTNSQLQAYHQKELHSKLWKMANDLRGSMVGSEFQNYILGMLFYRFLSDKTTFYIKDILSVDGITYKDAWEIPEYKTALIQTSLDELGYLIEPRHLFESITELIYDDMFDIEIFIEAIKSLIDSTRGQKSEKAFQGLFDDMDLHSTKLGKDVKSRSALIGKIMTSIEEIHFTHLDTEIDILGSAYEYLISMYSQQDSRSNGEFFTEIGISTACVKLVTHDLEKVRSAYDPTSGSGGLLLGVRKHIKVGKLYGQEKISSTVSLSKMSLILHGLDYNEFEIYNGDTLEDDHFAGEKFDIQTSNPPYSIPYSASPKFLEDERFAPYGTLAPKSKADWAFVQHMIHHMADDGRIAVVLPHGVLFRGGSEGVIRRFIIEQYNYLDAVIGLPAGLFLSTKIPTLILIFKKNRGENKDNILFIDGSKDYEQGKNQNRLRDEDIDKIVNTYIKREDVSKYSKKILLSEIADNDYNLNIPRYVDTFEEEERIDIELVNKEISEIDEKIQGIQSELKHYFDELGIFQ